MSRSLLRWLLPILLGCASLAPLAASATTGTGDTGATDTGTAPTSPPTDTGTAPTDPGTADTGTAPTDPGANVDGDRDGYTPAQGDCDDTEREVNPGQEEICADQIDNDCNGLFDDRCDDSAKLASLRGGGGCTGGQSVLGTQVILVLALGGLARRSRVAQVRPGSRSR